MIFDKGNKTIIRKRQSFQQYLKNWISTHKKVRLDSHLTTYTKTNSKWIKTQVKELKTIKSLEENIEGEALGHWIWQ